MNKLLRAMLLIGIIAFYGGFALLILLGTETIKNPSNGLVDFDFYSIFAGAILSIIVGPLLVLSNAMERSRKIAIKQEFYKGKYKDEIYGLVIKKMAQGFALFDFLYIGVMWLIWIIIDTVVLKVSISDIVFITAIVSHIAIFQRSKPDKDEQNIKISVNGVEISEFEELGQKTTNIHIDSLVID